jgi:hypothetical protein
VSSDQPDEPRTDLIGKILDAAKDWMKTVDPRYGAACTLLAALAFLYLTIRKDLDYLPWTLGALGLAIGQWGAHVKRQQAAKDQGAKIDELQRQLVEAQEALAAQIKRNTDITVTAAASSQQAQVAIASAVGAVPPPIPFDPAIIREIGKQEIRASGGVPKP